jgi:hypothetical protein
MSKLKQFAGTCLLVVSMAAVTWADGGSTLGPGLTSPLPPECTTNCTNSQTTPPAPDATVTVDVVNVLVIWLVESIL